jgi:N-acetylmuramoyl-L-alanine amidase
MLPLNDHKTIAKWTMVLEAEDQGEEGLIAVGWVIKNRTKRASPSLAYYADVCTAKWQFSCWNEFRWAVDRLHKVKEEVINKVGVLFDLIHENKIPDPTNGATHYLNVPLTKQINNGHLPNWVSKLTWTCKIGDHDFYKE